MAVFSEQIPMFRLLLLVYSFLYTLVLVLYLPPALWIRSRKGKQTALKPRIEAPVLPPKQDHFVRIWIQAVSVGEVNAIRPIVAALRESPSTEVVISTTTPTGQAQALTAFGQQCPVFYFPLDAAWICRRFLKACNPDLILLAETELWPNFMATAAERSIPILLVNGRFSDRSSRRYQRFRWFFGPLVSLLDHACMQSKVDKQRMLQLGLPEAKASWVGNLKFDHTRPPSTEKSEVKQLIRSTLLANPESMLWVCGSTKPGEEEQIAAVFAKLHASHPTLKLLIAPRHPHRAEEVEAILKSHGIVCTLRSRLAGPSGSSPDAVVLDTIGELAHLYEIADLVFIGGSLVPQGGQNPIEAAVWGKPILFGPDMSNFREIAGSFVESYAALQVTSPADLAARLDALIADAHAREWLGRNARKVILQNQGAVQRTLDILRPYLTSARPAAKPTQDVSQTTGESREIVESTYKDDQE